MIPKQLRKNQFKFVKIKHKNKAPYEKEWQKKNNYVWDDKILQSHIKLKGNYGIVTGYGNLCVIDFDNKEYQEKIIPMLPKTFTVRSGGGLKHLYYYIDVSESFKILDQEKTTILDFQGEGKQIVAPGSIHPNGNKYEVLIDEEIKKIELSTIKSVFYSIFPEDYIPKNWNTIKIKDYKKENNHQLINDIKTRYTIRELLKDQGIDTNKNPTKCPLHSSKGGKSLGFNEEVWHCFHCEEKGDVITLYQLIYGLDFNKATKELAEKLNIEYKPFNNERDRFKKQLAKNNDRIQIMQNFIYENPIYYDSSKIWWVWSFDENKWVMVDETDILNLVREELDINTIDSKTRNEIIESLKQLGRYNKPKNPPLEWIQFKNIIFDIKNKRSFTPTSEYFFTNPINWDVSDSEETPTIDKLFNEWVGDKYTNILYEIIAYCLYREYPIHRIFCFTGIGRNGKSKYLELIKRFIGSENTTSTELDILINNRFESAKLYKKLICQLGETNDSALQNTALLKKLSGQDTIGYEFKNKNPFDDINYAKILIATNNLPTTLDKSDGFYRRWLIIDFPNQFPEGKDILATIPSQEYNNLARKCINIIAKILDNGKFTNEPSIEEKAKIYEQKSSIISFFISEKYDRDINSVIPLGELYNQFTVFSKDRGYRDISYNSFAMKIKTEGFVVEKEHYYKDMGERSTRRVVVGIKEKVDTTGYVGYVSSNSFPYRELIVNLVSNVSKGIHEHEIFAFCRGLNENFEVKQAIIVIEELLQKGDIVEISKGIYRNN